MMWKGARTSLGGAKVLARSGSTGASATSLLDAQSATLDDFALHTILGSIGLVGRDHLDKTESTRLLGVGVLHDLALLNLAILLKKARNLCLGESGVNASDEEVGARVDGSIVIITTATTTAAATLVLGCAIETRVRYRFGTSRLFEAVVRIRETRESCDFTSP